MSRLTEDYHFSNMALWTVGGAEQGSERHLFEIEEVAAAAVHLAAANARVDGRPLCGMFCLNDNSLDLSGTCDVPQVRL